MRDIYLATTDRAATMKRCAGCGALFPDVFPAPEDWAQAYGDYYTRRAPGGGWRGALRRPIDRSRRAYLRRDLPPGAGRLLDYGCGAGAYLASMKTEGSSLEAFGTDLATPPTPAGAFTWLAPGQIAAAGPFDWITLGHVLEHLADPSGVLATLGGALAPGGGVWIATPNADSFLFATAGAWARDIDFPRHREIVSRAGLERMLAEAGLEARFVSPPRINAGLNALATLGAIIRDRASPRSRRARAFVATLGGLARHWLSPRARRDAVSPELIAICARRASGARGRP